MNKKHQPDNVFTRNDRSYDNFTETLKLLDEQIETSTYKHTLSESGRNSIREFINEFLA
jgi:hypothetical protein